MHQGMSAVQGDSCQKSIHGSGVAMTEMTNRLDLPDASIVAADVEKM